MDKLSRPMQRSNCFAMGHLVLFCYIGCLLNGYLLLYGLLVKWVLVVIWVTCCFIGYLLSSSVSSDGLHYFLGSFGNIC